MPRFFTGDELGAIKSVAYATGGDDGKEWKASTSVLVSGSSSGRSKTVQKLALHRAGSDTLLAAVHADGSAAVRKLQGDSVPAVVYEWSEIRLKEKQRFVGLDLKESGAYTCTSNGALRLIKFAQDSPEPSSSLATLPMRLCEWRLSEDERAFAYGGDEVELSVWDTERAFSQEGAAPTSATTQSKKRKRAQELLHGELWRAKNLPNDHLDLRQPVHNTALTFLQPSPSPVHQHILAGTAQGALRRYDTRAGRRPVAAWKNVATSGINTVEKGSHDNEVFFADRCSTLGALDLRNGKTICTYKGISGAVTSVAPAQSFMASAAEDRFIRLHSTFGPPAEAGKNLDRKGEVLDKLYMKVIPTVVVWDASTDASGFIPDEEEEGVDEVWDAMEAVQSESEGEGKSGRRKEKKIRAT
ncbi:hypothetical protein L226DRAFT_608942 [Lentinus tigrinus ALCF2SS1-7]|uniref:Ribosome biogenesis protein NSA1 n=1 Tax=Lentinus tigrinus ALCF2SS1-6 TaxID=1328759 RepID=A0A5C2SZE4_9APHY|nr:hypothetical protein L227DRAFT_569959 [Lentinus tigrinus ALCF2SS1-6]RPD79964.1 hypothetical protein L226DRAFT_608942 [Lentinus tigrinus ALCF2SS1-7]